VDWGNNLFRPEDPAPDQGADNMLQQLIQNDEINLEIEEEGN